MNVLYCFLQLEWPEHFRFSTVPLSPAQLSILEIIVIALSRLFIPKVCFINPSLAIPLF